jgi:hypothetical protein
MSIAATLKALKERRDFYAAAVTALEKVAAYDVARTDAAPVAAPRRVEHRGRFVRTPEMRARMAEAQHRRFQRERLQREAAALPSSDNGNHEFVTV